MIILMWFLFQITLLIMLNIMSAIVSPVTYVEKSLLTFFITGIVYLIFIVMWQSRPEAKTKNTLKQYLAYIFLGVGICLFHRIIFVFFPQIGMSLYEQIGKENYNSLLYNFKNPGIFIYISIIGPILEEIFYRGRLLKEALKKYKSKYAVIIVSVLFAISHANLPQFISALCLGLLCGGVYVMAKDIKAPITIHVANNLYSSMMTLWVGSYETYKVSEFRMVGSIIIGLVLTLLGVFIFYKEKNRNI